MSRTNRRAFIRRGVTAAAGAAAATAAVAAQTAQAPPAAYPAEGGRLPLLKKVHSNRPPSATNAPLFNSTVSVGNMIFIAGVGYHEEGDIKVHTKGVLDSIEAQLKRVGSSMDRVVKCNVYLAPGKDAQESQALYDGMNQMFRGRFGAEPPVRTTIAAAWIPGNSLIEIDVIAMI